jgi:hypothetical protein
MIEVMTVDSKVTGVAVAVGCCGVLVAVGAAVASAVATSVAAASAGVPSPLGGAPAGWVPDGGLPDMLGVELVCELQAARLINSRLAISKVKIVFLVITLSRKRIQAANG